MAKTVGNVMTREVVTVRPEATFREAVRLLEDRRVDALPVVDGTGRVVGMLSEGDLLLKEELADGPRGLPGLPWQRRRDRARAAATTVAEAMTRQVVSTTADASLCAAARLMHRHRVGGLPVVDSDRRLQGIVTRSDLLQVFLTDDDELCAEVADSLGPELAGKVSCAVSEGRVTLRGQLRLLSEVREAVAAARRVPGVIEVEDSLGYEIDDEQVMVGGY